MTAPTESPSVTVVARHTVQCANENPSSEFNSSSTVYLGAFDQTIPTLCPTTVLFVYRQHEVADPISVGLFQRAMELLLDYYPHLTGRLLLEPYRVVDLGTGAELVVAQCSDRLDAFSLPTGYISAQKMPDSGKALLPPYVGTAQTISNEPLLSIQHTRFACGGVSLGLRVNHQCCDGYGYFQLMRHLAELYRGLRSTKPKSDDLKTHRTPRLSCPPQIKSYTCELVKDMTPEEKESALKYETSFYQIAPEVNESVAERKNEMWEELFGGKKSLGVGRILHISAAQVKALKALATNPNGGDNWVSTFDATSALLHQSIYQARKTHLAATQTTLCPPLFATIINVRGSKRLPDIPDSYFPNAVFPTHMAVSPDTLLHAPLWQIAEGMHAMTRSLPKVEDIKANLRWIAAQPDKSRIQMELGSDNGALLATHWSGFDMYEGASFEEGELPAVVLPPMTEVFGFAGICVFLQSHVRAHKTEGCAAALDIVLVLEEQVWDILDRDERFTKFCSTLIKFTPPESLDLALREGNGAEEAVIPPEQAILSLA